jgi:hypothetical protein
VISDVLSQALDDMEFYLKRHAATYAANLFSIRIVMAAMAELRKVLDASPLAAIGAGLPPARRSRRPAVPGDLVRCPACRCFTPVEGPAGALLLTTHFARNDAARGFCPASLAPWDILWPTGPAATDE